MKYIREILAALFGALWEETPNWVKVSLVVGVVTLIALIVMLNVISNPLIKVVLVVGLFGAFAFAVYTIHKFVTS